MSSPRRSQAIAIFALTPLLLAGCEKPDPGVTAWSGTNSVRANALCWQHDGGAALGTGDCATDILSAAAAGQGVQTLDVQPGATIGISVDTVVADAGWSVQIGSQPVASNLTNTYFRFTFPETGIDQTGTGFVMQVTANAAAAGTRGHWFFRLQPV